MSTSTPQRGGLGASISTAQRPAGNALSSLLAQANSLNKADYDSELPQIRFGIDDIERMSETVAGRGKRGRSERVEAFNLLSTLGVNTSQLTQSISQLPSEPSVSRPRRRRPAPGPARLEPLPDVGPSYPVADGDIGAWGRNWHEMVILSGIEMQRQKTINSFQKQFQQRILQNWQVEKARILQDELGVTDDELAGIVDAAAAAAGPAGLGGSTLGKSALGASTRRFPMGQSTLRRSTATESREGGLVMHNKMVRYEKVVVELNDKRLRREPIELCQRLAETVKNDPKYPLLSQSFTILAHLSYEPSLRVSEDNVTASADTAPELFGPIQERQYSSAYLADPKTNQAATFRGRLIVGGKKFLERDFERHVDEVIVKNPKEAALGGVPGIKNKIRAFVDVTLRTKEAQETYKPESVNGSFIWAQAYYLVRCGYAEDAIELMADNTVALNNSDASFPGCFKTAFQTPDHRLPKSQRDHLYSDFNAHIRNNAGADQFKYALYKLVGRFELNRKTVKVATTTEDWMWVQLSLVRENKDGDAPQEQYDLADLGRLLEKYGSDKFDANGTKPLAWFNLLLFTAQFEKAVAYLYAKPQLKTDALHFAVALSYYGLLRVTPKGDEAELLSMDDATGAVCLNFARLIKQYIGPFFKLEPQTALQYAYLVALNSDAPGSTGPKQKQLCLELVRDIVLSSRSWSRLLGSVRADGSKETGVIEHDLKLLKLEDEQDYLRQVVLAAADQSSLDASLTDSIELYHLAGAYDRVVETVNRALGHSLGQAGGAPLQSGAASIGLSGAFGGAADLYGLAQKVYVLYENDLAKRSRVSTLHWETLETLLRLKLALAEFAADRPDLALETFKSTNLLPLDNDPSAISRYAQKFRDMLDQPVISNLDDVIVTTMKCLHLLSQQLKQSAFGDSGRVAQLEAYRHQAQCLIQFASTLRLRLGPDVYRQLSSMSAFF